MTTKSRPAWDVSVVRQIVKDASWPWGKGWELLHDRTKSDAIAARVLYNFLGQSSPVEPDQVRELLNAALDEGGVS